MADWDLSAINITIEDNASSGSIVTVRVSTPAGVLLAMGQIEDLGRELVLIGVHIQSETLRPNLLGWAKVRQLARALAEKADVDAVIVKGAARTTGARVGRIPGELRFTRAIRPAC
ncbi:MAG TPA: hypothetical protein VF007_03050 [Stellaceae bacterium]